MANCSTNSVVPHSAKSSEPISVSSNGESSYNPMHSEYQVPTSMVGPNRMYTSGGTYNAFYGGGNTVNYPEADRYAGGYQRNVPTIDLTRFSLGGQTQFPPFGRHAQRYDDSNYRHYHGMPGFGGKQWNGNAVVEQASLNTSKTGSRGRTTYSDEQIAELENVFNTNPYPTAQMRQHLAFKIDVPEGKVKIWFQNRRARAKKFKISCAESGWRLQLNDSRSSEEQGNQNNNNTNNDSTTKRELLSTSTFSMKTFLPLPTKPVAESLMYSRQNASKLQQQSKASSSSSFTNSKTSQHFFPGRSTAACISSNSASSSDNGATGKPPGWIWSSTHVPSQFPTVQRTSLRHAEEYQCGRKETTSESWRNNAGTNAVPDLVTQTSRVGLSESSLSTMDRNESNEQHSKDDNTSTNITTAFQENSLQDAGITGPNGRVISSESKSPEPLSICESPPNAAFPGSQGQLEKPSSMSFAEFMKSPPPIRRLVFPFQTLPDSKMNSGETGLQGLMSYPPIPGKYPNPIPYCTANQNSVGNRGNAYPAKMSYRTRDTYHTTNFSKGLTPHFGNIPKRVHPCEEQGHAYIGSSSWYCDPVRPTHGGMGSYQSVSKYMRHNSSLAQPVGEQVVDSSDDVHQRDVRRMDVTKTDDRENADGGIRSYPTDGGNGYQPYWSSVSVVTSASKNEEARDSTASAAERLVNFSNDAIPQDDANATWTNQLITGFNPPVSASIVS